MKMHCNCTNRCCSAKLYCSLPLLLGGFLTVAGRLHGGRAPHLSGGELQSEKSGQIGVVLASDSIWVAGMYAACSIVNVVLALQCGERRPLFIHRTGTAQAVPEQPSLLTPTPHPTKLTQVHNLSQMLMVFFTGFGHFLSPSLGLSLHILT